MATPKKASTNVTKAPPAPTTDEIAERAHEIFVARGGEHGHDLNDWLEAESELLNERASRRRPQS